MRFRIRRQNRAWKGTRATRDDSCPPFTSDVNHMVRFSERICIFFVMTGSASKYHHHQPGDDQWVADPRGTVAQLNHSKIG